MFLEWFGQTVEKWLFIDTHSMALWNNQGVEQDHHVLHKTFKMGACDQYATTSSGNDLTLQSTEIYTSLL